MTLTARDGSTIKRVYEHDKEIEICKLFKLEQITVGKGRKADAVSDEGLVSIKNAKSSLTQVHLTGLPSLPVLRNTYLSRSS